MNNIKGKLLRFEEEFETVKSKFEKYHLYFVSFFFVTSLGFVFFYNKYFTENMIIKYSFFSYIIIGLVVHYFLRYKFHKSKSRYKKFYDKVFKALEREVKDASKLNSDITDAVKEIFQSRNMELNEHELKNLPFWELLLLNLNLKI